MVTGIIIHGSDGCGISVGKSAGLWYPDKKPGDMFSEGEKLGKVTDYEGKTLETSYGGYDGVILFQTGSLQVTKEGPMIAYGRIAYEKDDRKEKIAGYWTKRSQISKSREEKNFTVHWRNDGWKKSINICLKKSICGSWM